MNSNNHYNVLNKEILDFIKFTSEDLGFDYQEFLNKFKDSSFFKEFQDLVNKFNKTEDKEKIKNKFSAFEYKLKYKLTEYTIPICRNEDYKLFIQNIECLIQKALKKNKKRALELLYNFLINIFPVLSKDKRLTSEIMISTLTRENFEKWVKNKLEELKGKPIEIIRYLIHKEIKNVESPVWEKFRKLKGKVIKDKVVKEKNAEELVNNIKDYYEAFRIVCGMLIALFDIFEDSYDENLRRSYFGDKFNTDDGFYSRRKIQDNNSLSPDNRPTLKEYFRKYGCNGLKDFFNWLMTQIKPIRITGAHHMMVIEQENLANYKFKIKYKKGIQDVNIGFIEACRTGLTSFITLTYWVVSYFFYDNLELVDKPS